MLVFDEHSQAGRNTQRRYLLKIQQYPVNNTYNSYQTEQFNYFKLCKNKWLLPINKTEFVQLSKFPFWCIF